jgi:fibronectin type 3 domain-containing protein
MSLEKPKAPTIVEAKYQNGKIILKWSSADKRATNYVIRKTYKEGWFSTVKHSIISSITDTHYLDSMIESGLVYKYRILTIDKYGLSSLPSDEVEVKVPAKL